MPTQRLEGEIALQAAAVAARARLAVGNRRDVADLAGIAPGAAHDAALVHHRTADTDAEIEVVVVGELGAEAVELLAQRRSRHVGLQEGCKARGL